MYQHIMILDTTLNRAGEQYGRDETRQDETRRADAEDAAMIGIYQSLTWTDMGV